MDEDLQQIFQIVQNKLSETSLTEINESIRNVILQYFDSTTSQYVNTESPSIQAIQIDSAEMNTMDLALKRLQSIQELIKNHQLQIKKTSCMQKCSVQHQNNFPL